MQWVAAILAICQLISITLHTFHCACTKLPYFYFWFEIQCHYRVLDPISCKTWQFRPFGNK